MEPLSASDFNSSVRDGIDPVVRPLGFAARGKGAPSWSRKRGEHRTSFRFERHPKAVDFYQGGQFSIEFEHSTPETPKLGMNGRAFFDQLLNASELERVLAYQSEVIASLPHPPASHVSGYPESLRETYLQSFRPERTFQPGTLQLRFRTFENLGGWLSLIGSLLPSVLARAERLDPKVLYLASPIDLEGNPLRPTNPVVLRRSSPS